MFIKTDNVCLTKKLLIIQRKSYYSFKKTRYRYSMFTRNQNERISY
ncbi:hypothetical protein PFFCH_03887 [Plasmodium falciparum FCH/4]|uniref:Uncharacterized protein n=1 Tax=Plasmodium falciparum FCH/4 TaxID=1036724 RepID=A0A024VKD7_PLAFA|nr:hypothetical protein PFFCH_03887 [Plasmodium falciparum FCH/4]